MELLQIVGLVIIILSTIIRNVTTLPHVQERNKGLSRLSEIDYSSSPLVKRGLLATINHGEATFYDVGLGACEATNTNTEFVGALNHIDFGSEVPPRSSPACSSCVLVWAPSIPKTPPVRVKIVDKCPGCNVGDIDLSPAVFNHFFDPGKGRFDIVWAKFSCDGGPIASLSDLPAAFIQTAGGLPSINLPPVVPSLPPPPPSLPPPPPNSDPTPEPSIPPSAPPALPAPIAPIASDPVPGPSIPPPASPSPFSSSTSLKPTSSTAISSSTTFSSSTFTTPSVTQSIISPSSEPNVKITEQTTTAPTTSAAIVSVATSITSSTTSSITTASISSIPTISISSIDTNSSEMNLKALEVNIDPTNIPIIPNTSSSTTIISTSTIPISTPSTSPTTSIPIVKQQTITTPTKVQNTIRKCSRSRNKKKRIGY